MKRSVIVIKSPQNSLSVLPADMKAFEWDTDESSYSREAFKYIESLMMQQRAFTVDTLEASEYYLKREETVASAIESLTPTAELNDSEVETSTDYLAAYLKEKRRVEELQKMLSDQIQHTASALREAEAQIDELERYAAYHS